MMQERIDELEARVYALEVALTNLKAEFVLTESRISTSDDPLESIVRRLLDRVCDALQEFRPASTYGSDD